MSTNRITGHSFPGLYESMGVDETKFGFIMLNVEPQEVLSHVSGGAEDIYEHPDIEKYPYARGLPIETKAHCTLLGGLMQSGQELRPQIDRVLSGWQFPELEIEEVSFFGGTIPGEDYSVIVAKIKVTDELLDGHQRLQILPHVDTFPGYHPHITIAYVKNGSHLIGERTVSTVEKWIAELNEHFAGKTFSVTGLNYGS